jgi:ribose transport system permease protein
MMLPQRVSGLRSQSSLMLAVGAAIVLFAVGAIAISGFDSRYSVTSILTQAAILGVASIGQTLVILIGGIDLSIPYVIGLGEVVAGELTGQGWPFVATIALVLVLALAIGATSGILSSLTRTHPLVITLGMGFVVQGAVLVWNGGLATGSSPGWLTSFVSSGSDTGPIPVPPVVVFWLILAVIVALTLRSTRFGRMLHALGANREAARLALVRPTLMWGVTFALSAAMAAITGVLLLGFSGSVDAQIGSPYLFETVGAVVVGGTLLVGGVGGYGRTVVGAIVITELGTALVGFNLNQAWLETVLGALIIVVVALYGRQPSLRNQI